METFHMEEAYSFDDVLLMPNRSAVLPNDVDTGTQLTRNISLNIPITSVLSVPAITAKPKTRFCEHMWMRVWSIT